MQSRYIVYVGVLLLFLLTSCFSRTAMISKKNFEAIPIGSTVHQLEEQVGKPDAIHSTGLNRQEFEYVERLELNPYYSIENRYFIEIMQGVVTAKRTLSRRSPAYDFMYQGEPNFSPDYSSP